MRHVLWVKPPGCDWTIGGVYDCPRSASWAFREERVRDGGSKAILPWGLTPDGRPWVAPPTDTQGGGG